MKRRIMFCLYALFCMTLFAQQRPKLVVGLVVDQMRWDYLMRYHDRYGEDGFRRLLSEGCTMDNCQINYIPTITAIGHTSVYTGSVPSIHGIAGNEFRMSGRWVTSVTDTTVVGVGTDSKKSMVSPRNLLTTTISDELKLATNFRSRVIGVALKDRAAILPAGHCANAAYWYDDKTGSFVSSTYYMSELPDWAKKFNAKKLPQKFMEKPWETLYPLNTYKQSTADDVPYEGRFLKNMTPTFPIDVPAIRKEWGNAALRYTPSGITATFEMAKAALHGEKLGQGETCDMLAVSISSTDIIGHQFGINSIEVEDTYLRLDRDLAEFLNELDRTVGRGNYLFFLTADHGAANNISFNQEHKIPSQGWSMGKTRKSLNEFLQKRYSTTEKFIYTCSNCQVFLDHKAIQRAGVDEAEVRSVIVDFLKADERFAYVVDMEKVASSSIPQPIRERIINGYNRLRSGDIQIVLQPAHYGAAESGIVTGTTHGVWNPYDAHIPCVFMGWKVQHGKFSREVHITDIAPTVCSLLGIQMPNGCIGEPIREIAH